MTLTSRLAGAALCIGTFSAVAAADPALTAIPATLAISPGGFYFAVGLGGQAFDQPRFNSYQLSTGADLFSVTPQLSGVGGVFAFGYLLPQGILGSLGDAARVELVVDGVDATGHDTASLSGSFHQAYTSIDGRFSGVGNLTKTAYSGTLNTNFRALEFGPRFKFDRQVSPDITLTPSAALLYGIGHSSDDYSFFFVPGGGILPGFVRETVNSRRIGPELGLDATWKASPSWSFHGGLSASLYRQSASFSGTDCATNNTLASGNCDGTLFATGATGAGTNVGAKLSPSLGATYSIGGVRLTAVVNASWTANVPGVTNPSQLGRTANLMYQNEWGYGGMLQATVPLQ